MNIYLDVDGVLLNHDGTLANHADEFLAAMVHSGHPVHWLTTRCRDGDSSASTLFWADFCSQPRWNS